MRYARNHESPRSTPDLEEAVIHGEDIVMSVAMAAFARKLRELRTQRGWTKQHLADELGMGLAQIHRYEKASSQPTLDVIRKMATVFRVSADELVFDKGTVGPAAAHIKGRLLPRFEKVAQLPDAEQDVIVYLLDAIIARAEFAASMAESAPSRRKAG
jgi:transcriptional regulator with XRE-family HTH domain